MKVLFSWLRDFVDVPGRAEDVAATMSLRGFAVEGLEPLADGDAVLDFEVTGNRPDCMSVGGIAREVATAYGLQVRRPVVSSSLRRTKATAESGPALHLASLKTVERGDIEVVIESPNLCPRYAGAVVIEHGLGGSRAGAPVAKDVLTYLFDKDRAMASLQALEQGWGGNISERMARRAAAWANRAPGETLPNPAL